ncbi:unnamed protein product [Fusarium graminearum]|uniref:Chromosome 4, complete genome n=1 Tax=Gibberella zeae (strain ATCC MYA-4620 / CBS 123657 / FGSC 9075 / NRRL 31084 / PH-1) TaxID=229533 RepID=A0A1C3YLJ7_GIBZE|nr:unnamed protein product [Fusarium graminearum]
MAMFLPGLEVTKFVTEFVNSSQCEEVRNSGVFDIEERNKVRPDRRTGTGYMFREKEFWNEWNEFYNDDEEDESWPERYLMEWSLTVRPTLAHCCLQGGSYNPGKRGTSSRTYQGHSHSPNGASSTWQARSLHQLQGTTRKVQHENRSVFFGTLAMARNHPARFALLRTWSSPHYYPFMCDGTDRYSTTFLDSRNRSWAWRFVPKDMTASEYSPHETIKRRLGYLKHQFGSRVINRGDLILVMGEDEDDLFKYCITVTLAIQTKPWMWEIDLWKSFINVDMDFIERMEEH